MTDWTGKHIVVTGGASGIGQATVGVFKAGGARVTVIDRDAPKDTVDHWIKADLANLAAIPSIDCGSRIDALVNAAGLPPRPGTEACILRINFFALRALTHHLRDRIAPGGAIVNMASKAGGKWRDNLDQVRRLTALGSDADLDTFVAQEKIDPVRAYDLSKEAVITFGMALVAPLRKRGIRVNALSPAAIETPILPDFMAAFQDRATRGVAITGRPGRPDEIARIIAFLASPDASWITGCNIECDGGLTTQLQAERLGLGDGVG
jgi:NAD(P)-dependent dehydrogenase (short-subunit alcohol dehydrogenase family)